MTESMKFGPEWLMRNLSEAPVGGGAGSTTGGTGSSGTTTTSTPPQPQVRYQLAEYRYGREEMLALFSTSLVPPDSLRLLVGLYVEKAQPPLALSHMSDEETRMWSRGINSDAMLRSAAKGEGRGGATRGSGGGSRGGRGGRGGVGSGTGGSYYQRGVVTGCQGPGGEGEEQQPPYGRQPRVFDRSQSERGRDSWNERNGGEGRGGGASRSSDINWRRQRGGSGTGGEDDDWRMNKWSLSSRSGSNWREEDNWDTGPHSKNHHLPEWATEKNSEGGGTFDSSGAFHGSSEPPPEEEESTKNKIEKQMKSLSIKPPDGGEVENLVSSAGGRQTTDREKRDNQQQPNQQTTQQNSHHQDPPIAPSGTVTPPSTNDQHPKQSSLHNLPIQQQQENQEEQKLPPEKQQPPDSPRKDVGIEHQVSSRHSTQQQHTTTQQTQQLQVQQHQHPLHSQQQIQQQQQQQQIIPNPKPAPVQQQPLQIPLQSGVTPPHPPIEEPPVEDPLGHMTDDQAAEIVAKLMEDEEKQDKQWFYRDPQGQVQGPFGCNEMAEWFQSGYFSLNLLVRRACDPSYAPLGELIKLWGCIPFLPEQHPLNKEPTAVMMSTQLHENMLMQHYQHQYRQQAARMQQQPHLPSKVPPHDWLDHQPMIEQVLPPQYQPIHHHPNSSNLRALLAQMQQQSLSSAGSPLQQPFAPTVASLQLQPQQPPLQSGSKPRTTEEISRKVSDFLRGLQAKSEAQAAAATLAAQQAVVQQQQQQQQQQQPGGPSGQGGGQQVMETLLSLHQQQQQLASTVPQTSAPQQSLQNLIRQMQATQQNKMQQQQHLHSNSLQVESVWNGGNWNQWSHLNAKGIKTEQQVLEEQLRAEDERKREELRKQEEAVKKRLEEDCCNDEKDIRSKRESEMLGNMLVDKAKRENEEQQRRHEVEDDIRKKQEASRRAEVERQRKGEEKRKKEEERRKKEEEKRKREEEKERERLREGERKKKEALAASEEAAKKRAADLMAKVQRSQWCPPAVSNTSILDIQRSEREQQQLLRGLQQQQQQQQHQHLEKSNSGMQLKWTETQRQMVQPVESLAEIQAEQQRQFFKQLEKEKAEREKEKAANNSMPVGSLGSWSQGLTWATTNLSNPAWQSVGNPLGGSVPNNNSTTGGFWDQMSAASLQQSSVSSKNKNCPVVGKQQQQTKESGGGKVSSKVKRDELAVMKLFNNTGGNDEFNQWCTAALTNIQSNVDIPTFVTFLREVESAGEVQEYVKMYLGDSQDAYDFARQFVERRNNAKSGGNMGLGSGGNSLLLAGNGGGGGGQQQQSSDFQQVKGKSKKTKKGRMQKVDTRILGFSTTSASDRINVGDREYPEDL